MCGVSEVNKFDGYAWVQTRSLAMNSELDQAKQQKLSAISPTEEK